MIEQSGERTPAPGDLSVVQAFVNSADIEAGQDALGDVDSASSWLRANDGGERTPLDEAERRRLVEVREALRDVLSGHTGEEATLAAGRLTEMLSGAVLRPVITVHGAELVPACPGVDTFLATLGSAIVEATVAGTWDRLKVCRDDTCRWAFYDHSKNGRGAWCTMRVCGNRAKARAYRERRRAATG